MRSSVNSNLNPNVIKTNFTIYYIILFALILSISPHVLFANALPNFSDLVKKNGPAVVNISSVQKAKPQVFRHKAYRNDAPDVLRYFFGENFELPQEDKLSLGSGFIISKDGYILTNYHVIEGADEVIVRLQDRRELTAKIIGSDSKSDLALLKIEAKNLPKVTLGKSKNLSVGEWVLAIGTPFGFEASATKGIVSYLGRSLSATDYVPYIQTDVPINSGNSGGPLFNLKGEVVGINSRIYSHTGGFMGLSFAIPIDTAMHVVEQIKTYGKVRRGWLGVSIRDVNTLEQDSLGLDNLSGAYVVDIVKNSPAGKAGILSGDIILSFDNKKVDNASSLPVFVGETEIDSQVTVEILRDKTRQRVEVQISTLPGEAELNAQNGQRGLGDKLGLSVQAINNDQEYRWGISFGVSVESVLNDPAMRAGILEGDIITRVNNQEVADIDQYNRILAALPHNKWIPVLVYRQGRPVRLPVHLLP